MILKFVVSHTQLTKAVLGINHKNCISQLAKTCSKLTIETPEQGVKCVQS